MNCHNCREIVVDVARSEASARAEQDARRHMESCAACADWLQKQQRLTAALRVLASVPEPEELAARLEQRLLATVENARASFVDAVAIENRTPPPPLVTGHRFARGWWLAAAATVAIAASILGWWQAAGPSPRPAGRRDAAQAAHAGPTPGDTEVAYEANKRLQTGAGAATHAREQEEPAAGRLAAVQRGPAGPRGARDANAQTGAAAARRHSAPHLVQPAVFVPLPAAAVLPPFERGEIVRVRIRLASLANLGFTVQPDAADPTPIDADLLVAQDGQPRAIRLVSNESQASSRSMR